MRSSRTRERGAATCVLDDTGICFGRGEIHLTDVRTARVKPEEEIRVLSLQPSQKLPVGNCKHRRA